MSIIDSNKQVVRRIFEDYVNTGRLERLHEVVSPDYVGVTELRGPEGFASPIAGLLASFPDIVYTLDDIVGDGDRVAVRWTWRGTHQSAFRRFAATGQPVVNTGFAMFQLQDGKLVRAWLETDRLGFLQALGAVPNDPAFGPPRAPGT